MSALLAVLGWLRAWWRSDGLSAAPVASDPQDGGCGPHAATGGPSRRLPVPPPAPPIRIHLDLPPDNPVTRAIHQAVVDAQFAAITGCPPDRQHHPEGTDR